VKPVNGRNPLVMKAREIRLPMPFEDEEEYDYEDEDSEGWDTSEWEDHEMPDPQSEDEMVNGAFPAPPKPRGHRMPPMPKAPKPRKRAKGEVWHPPFEVAPDGTVLGVKIAPEGAPPGEELPIQILEDGTRQVFDPPKGTMEGAAGMFRAPGSR
jgi:hypothetical protein